MTAQLFLDSPSIMSYNRGPTYQSSYSYESDSDSDDQYVPPRRQPVPPPPPPPAAPARRYGYDSDSDVAPSYQTQPRRPQPPPPPPPSLQPGRGYASSGPPPPPPKSGFPSPAPYHAPPPPGTYHSPPPTSAYHSSPPPGAYQSPPGNYRASVSHQSPPPPPPGNYRSSPPPVNYQPAPPPPGAYRGGAPPNGAYRPSPPTSARGTPPPSAYYGSQAPNKPHTPSTLNRTDSEDYSAYGISNTTRPPTGHNMTEDLSGRVGEKNARDLETPPAFDRRKTEDMALTIGVNVKRDETSMASKIGDLVSSSSEKLTLAQSVVDKVIENDTYKLAKDQLETILSPAKDVIAILDVMKNIHPVVGAILIKLEVDRRENDKSIAVLHLAMTNLLFILSYLEPTFDTADKIKTMLQKFLEEVCKTMNHFGNFCDAYYKQRGMVRMIRSSGYKKKLTEFATSFEDHKKELQYLMTTKTAATVTKMDTNVQDVSAKLDQVLAFINMQNPKERAIAKRIQEYPGGENRAVMDDKLLAKIGKIVGEEISSQTKFALRENIDDILKSNFARFGLKVETAMNEIKDAVQRSTETIMTRLDSGPHDLIQDEDIKAVWKDMVVTFLPGCRHFVDAVHHHFAQKFGKYTLETGEPHPEQWTLKFLSNIIFYPAIGDAIDEDGSGYISVHEANRFFNSRPHGWTPPQWLSYWAVGWYVNAVSYRHRCMALLESIEEASKKVMPQNKKILKPYLKKECYGKINLMLEGLYTDNLQYHGESTGSQYDSLGKFRRERMDDELTKMKAHISKTNYELDSKEAVLAVLGTHRVEVSVFCLLYLVLRRHKKILDFASSLVLEEMEFDSMVECIENIAEAFETRFRNLLESWRQQRLDTKYDFCSIKVDPGKTDISIGCFSGGIFEAWHEEFYDNQSDSDSDWDSDLDSSDNEEFKAEERVAHAEDASDPRKARDILLYGIPPQPSRAETKKLKAELAAKKAKKEAKKAKREASVALSDTDSDVATSYDKGKNNSKNGTKSHSYDSDSDDGSEPKKSDGGYGYDSGRPKSSAKRSVNEYDSDFDYEKSDLWDSDGDSDSGSASDSSASDFVTRKVKKPKVEERLADLEDQLTAMQATLKQILSLTKKNLSNR
ncbi:hypothetical protein DFH09DRAFT_1303774 [Mycena vulgaris]|nr:hypothetical protein DFH09DRAFT_1303774 [Mycena vulgaris]